MTQEKKRVQRACTALGQRPESVPTAAPMDRRGARVALAVVVLLALCASLVYALTTRQSPPATATPASPAATYVGAPACAECHASESAAWRGSQHALAMQAANEQSVLGDFNDAQFSYAGITSRFFRHDGGFYVRTDGPDGQLAAYRIKYTFGVAPLQQYLVEFPDGRLQALSIAWDTRPKAQGGERWFHLYPDETITHDDELHWTRAAQNWNFMCADCHSTGLRKNYDPDSDSFQTQWAEISVACEACHGPASGHLVWAEAKQAGKTPEYDDASKGLTARLDERKDAAWSVSPVSDNAVRSKPRVSEREIEVCAQCHARRGQIAEGYVPGKPFLDHYRPALLTSPLYHADGQQHGEVYDWGSFLQSRMYARGVTCADCHDPHSGKLRAQGNALCTACHLQGKYATAEHHHHPPGSTGAACVACHMPTTTYMVNDPRHDHSLRVPRPDLSVRFGTPNACTGCHNDRDAHWAAAQVHAWFGHDPQGYQRYAEAFSAAARPRHADARLREVATDAAQPPIARATALAGLEPAGSRASLDTLATALRNPDPLLRFGALQALARVPVEVRAPLAAPLLSDPVRTVRSEAVSVLAPVPTDRLDAKQRTAFARASAEYIEIQRYNADRAGARVNLGTFYAYRGDAVQAEAEISAAIALDPYFVPAYVNLADLYRATGRDADGERSLRDGLAIAPGDANLHHALGLTLVRLQRLDEALDELQRAAELEPGDARFAYVYAVALHSTGEAKAAIARLETALAAHPDDRDILQALVSFHGEQGEAVEARKYAARLQELSE